MFLSACDVHMLHIDRLQCVETYGPATKLAAIDHVCYIQCWINRWERWGQATICLPPS